MTGVALTDAGLVRLAQSGDIGALALLPVGQRRVQPGRRLRAAGVRTRPRRQPVLRGRRGRGLPRPEAIARGLEADLEAGVRLHVQSVIAGEGITIVQGAFENPADAIADISPEAATALTGWPT
jgi:hypothetical protein